MPRIQVITRKAYGGAYVVMNSKSIGADLAYAWPSAELAVMGPNSAVEIVYRRELAEAPDPASRRAELIDEYTERYANPYVAAERGYVDDVIDPTETRRVLVRSLRVATISTLRAEFVDTAQMKGIPWTRVLRRHVFRNAVLAVVAVYGVNLAYLISGTVLVENVFSLPGLGTLLVNSVSDRDYPVVQGVTLVFAVLIVGINLLTDLVQAALDPRVAQEIGT